MSLNHEEHDALFAKPKANRLAALADMASRLRSDVSDLSDRPGDVSVSDLLQALDLAAGTITGIVDHLVACSHEESAARKQADSVSPPSEQACRQPPFSNMPWKGTVYGQPRENTFTVNAVVGPEEPNRPPLVVKVETVEAKYDPLRPTQTLPRRKIENLGSPPKKG